ncbi:hypothetical protein JLBYU09_75 [Escherichia phage JLBYU09]|nr:hypothetical protein JLBYU09_75 [Escherichia phage JLBYU09]
MRIIIMWRLLLLPLPVMMVISIVYVVIMR